LLGCKVGGVRPFFLGDPLAVLSFRPAAGRNRCTVRRVGDDERDLVARAAKGDRQALGELLHRFGPVLYRTVLLPRLGSDAAARDALSETYARVVEKISLFVWREVGFYPWLRTVALHVAIDQLRARKRMVLWSEDDLARELDEATKATPLDVRVASARDGAAVKAKIEAALGRINTRYATAIRQRILEEKPRLEVAETLAVTPATFDVVLHRALAALKKELAG
jgi:RNA polymerase sigma factor (sigma-70 family)